MSVVYTGMMDREPPADVGRGMAHFPRFVTHEAARVAGCFHCGTKFSGRADDAGYAPGHGQFTRLCTCCGMKTYYDILTGARRTPGQPEWAAQTRYGLGYMQGRGAS